MPVRAEPTPNPNAMKFTVGAPVGGPGTYIKGGDVDVPFVAELLAVDGVASVFMTADFVTLTKTVEGDWALITEQATAILETAF